MSTHGYRAQHRVGAGPFGWLIAEGMPSAEHLAEQLSGAVCQLRRATPHCLQRGGGHSAWNVSLLAPSGTRPACRHSNLAVFKWILRVTCRPRLTDEAPYDSCFTKTFRLISCVT